MCPFLQIQGNREGTLLLVHTRTLCIDEQLRLHS